VPGGREKVCKGKKKEQYRHYYEKLKAQISVYAGKKNGTLSVLQDFMSKIDRGENIICDYCGHIIFGENKIGHDEGCLLLDNYYQYFTD
jgi:hypothetical protein